MIWNEFSQYKLSTVHFANLKLSIFNESDWPEIREFYATHIPKFVEAFEAKVRELK